MSPPDTRSEERPRAVNLAETPPSKGGDGPSSAEERALDAALLARAANGDGAAFQQLYARHHRRVHAVAYGLVRNAEDARDVVQEAFLRVFRHRADFAGQASFSTWLYRIVFNLSIDAIRRKGGRQAVEMDEEAGFITEAAGDGNVLRFESDPFDVAHRKRLVAAMQQSLDKLPPYHRAVILLREVEGLSYEEMAEAMNVSKGTIMSRLFHARKKMQAMLRESLGADAVPATSEATAPASAASASET